MNARSTKQSTFRDRFTLPIVIIMGAIVLWSAVSIVVAYPPDYYPRFYDEAVYMMDVLAPGALFTEHAAKLHYATFKLGYGLPLYAAVALFGDSGAMYLSTLLWALTILILSIGVYRRYGLTTAAILAATLAYSSLFGKYVEEVAPTTLEAALFALLWLVYRKRQYLLTGLVVGLIAFVDFKWALPTGLCVVLIELWIERERKLVARLQHIGGIGLAAMGVLAVATLLHPAYFQWLWGYITNHSGRVDFLQPSTIFVYDLYLFGSLPIVILAIAGFVLMRSAKQKPATNNEHDHSLGHALVIGGLPILFYSLLGQLKGLRFFAVTFPVLMVTSAVGIQHIVTRVGDWAQRCVPLLRIVAGVVVGFFIAGLIMIGADGPAAHLLKPAGFKLAVRQLAATVPHDGTVSSYMWPVVNYGWRARLEVPPYAAWGILNTDKYLILDPVVDRMSVLLYEKSDVDSLMMLRSVLKRGSDSLFSVPSGFYASKYFLAEIAVYDANDLVSWINEYDPKKNFATVYRINLQKLRAMTPGAR